MTGAEIAGIVGAGAAVAGSAASTAGAFTSAYKAYKWNKKLAEWQNEANLQNWNLANEYNTPSQQYERLRQAGLNPLYYGLDGNSTNAFESASAAPYVSPSIQNPFEGMQNLGVMLSDIKAKQAEVDNLQAQTAKTNNENLTETQRRENMKVQLQKDMQEIENMKATQVLTEAQSRSVEKGLEWIDRLNQAEVNYKESAAKFSSAQTKRIEELLEGEKILQAKGIEDFEYKWNALMAQAEKDSVLAGLSRLDIENYTLNHMQNGFMGSGLSLPNIIRRGKEFLKPKNKGQEPVNLYNGESIDQMLSHE